MRASATSRISSPAAAYGAQAREATKAEPASPFALLMQSAAPSANDKPAPKDDGKAENDKNEPVVAAKAGDAKPLPENQPAESKDSRASSPPAKTDKDEREPAEQEVAAVDPSMLAPIQPMPLPPAIPPQAAPPSPDMSVTVGDDELTIAAPVASQSVTGAPSAPMVQAAVPASNTTPPPDQASAPQPDDKAAAPQNPAPAQSLAAEQPVDAMKPIAGRGTSEAPAPAADEPAPVQSPAGPSIPAVASASQKPKDAGTDQTVAVATAAAQVAAAPSATPAPAPALKMPPAQSPIAATSDTAKADPNADPKADPRPAPAKAGTAKPAQADDSKSQTIAQLAQADAVKPAAPDAGNAPPKTLSTVPEPVTALAAPQAQPAPAPIAAANPLHVQITAQPHSPAPNLPALAVEIAAKSQSGTKQFDIRLDPPELGRVEVRLSIDATGKASAHLSADQRQTLDLLQKDAPALTRALREAGLQVSQDGLNFSLRQQAGDSGAQGQAGRRAPRGAALSATASLSSSATSAPMDFSGSRMGADGRLDIRV